MKSPIEQAIKEKIKALAKERETTFAELWSYTDNHAYGSGVWRLRRAN